jgi:GT2 family glycosyltransferase
MDVSIIIVNYNTTQLLIDAIDSVFAKTEGIEYEIIVVDNNSKETPKDILDKKYGGKVIFLRLPENVGFGRANNEAAKITKGRNLFLLNSDTVLLNNAVKILSDYLDDNPHVGCCGGNLVDKDENPMESFNRFFPSSLFDEVNQILHGLVAKFLYGKNLRYNHSNKPLKVCYISGADLMIRKVHFDKLCGFDSDFFMYFEEAELEYRLKKMNYSVISVPYARIIHLEGKSSSSYSDRLKNFFIARKIFLKKVYNPVLIVLINTLSIFWIKLHLYAWTFLRNNKKVTSWSELYNMKHSI